MRGKGLDGVKVILVLGITPACAGKSALAGAMQNHFRDHPRMCGEKDITALNANNWQGSPPHVRGKEPHHLINDIGHGITPAYAGKRESRSASGSACRDHPRMCGEKVSSTSPMKCLKGSPPHVRGKVVGGLEPEMPFRITPAYAGKRSGPSPAAVPAGPAGSCPASRPSQFPPRMTVIRPRP